MKPSNAGYCLDCQELFIPAKVNPSCPACASRAYVLLANLLEPSPLIVRIIEGNRVVGAARLQ
jgi:hypothetical protein